MKIDRELIRRLLKLDLQSRLAFGFLIAACLTGIFATVVSIWTINKYNINEVENRVRQDINTAKLIYSNKMDKIMYLIQFTAEGSDLRKLITTNNVKGMAYLERLIRQESDVQQRNEHVFWTC